MSGGLPDPVSDPQWGRILQTASHELRSPLSPVIGYVRMLLDQRVGPLSEQQQQLLEATLRSCGRLSSLLAEVSDLARLERNETRFKRADVDLADVLSSAIANLRELPDRHVAIALVKGPSITVNADAVWLRKSFEWLIHAVQREVVNSQELRVKAETQANNVARIDIAESTRLDALSKVTASALVTFDEWQEGTGLTLPQARRVIEAHGGRLLSPSPGAKACAVVLLPNF
jgi:two-component system, cell cycle sensor histidine kinase PleC